MILSHLLNFRAGILTSVQTIPIKRHLWEQTFYIYRSYMGWGSISSARQILKEVKRSSLQFQILRHQIIGSWGQEPTPTLCLRKNGFSVLGFVQVSLSNASRVADTDDASIWVISFLLLKVYKVYCKKNTTKKKMIVIWGIAQKRPPNMRNAKIINNDANSMQKVDTMR